MTAHSPCFDCCSRSPCWRRSTSPPRRSRRRPTPWLPAIRCPRPWRSGSLPPQELAGRELPIEEAVAIALANQPTIQNRIGAYVAAQQRVAQALSPLLPQLSGLWNGFQNKRSVELTGVGGRRRPSASRRRPPPASPPPCSCSTSARPGPPPMRPRPTASSPGEASSCRRTVIALAVKQSYYNLLFSSRLVVVNAQALDRAPT